MSPHSNQQAEVWSKTPEYQRQRYRENREIILAKKRAYRLKNRERMILQRRAYCKANRERILANQRAYSKRTREKWREYQRQYQSTPEYLAWRAAYLAKRKDRAMDAYLKRMFKISVEDYKSMLSAQNAKCAICLKVRRLVVDHNHVTGKVRSLLCRQCNTGIGLLGESHEKLTNAMNYLKRHAEISTAGEELC